MTYFTVVYQSEPSGEKYDIGILAPSIEAALKLFKSKHTDANIMEVSVGDKVIIWGEDV